MEIIGDYQVIIKIEKWKLRKLEQQIKQLKKQNDNLKSLLISKLPPHLNAIIECL